jgi:hypothetical protein
MRFPDAAMVLDDEEVRPRCASANILNLLAGSGAEQWMT